MVDTTQNLTGTVATLRIPDANAITKVNISPGDASQTANLGTGAPVNPVSPSSRPSVEVNSAAAEVLSSMQQMPAPVDIEAVTNIRAAISANEYPLNYSKIAESLTSAFESLT
jgi:negative regulator of flagellin synthesis FlgM